MKFGKRYSRNTGIANKHQLPARKLWYKVGVAVMILFTLFTGLFFYFNSLQDKQDVIVLGENQATLTDM